MKIFSASQIKELDQYTITHTPISSLDLMERAAEEFCQWLYNNYATGNSFVVFCGKGNNGGNGLAIARLLINNGYQVTVYVVQYTSYASIDFEANLTRLQQLGHPVINIDKDSSMPTIPSTTIILDALLGIGVNRPAEDLLSTIIHHINQLPNECIAVDIPSGLYADRANEPSDPIIKATHTVSFEFPKLSFLLPQNELYCGQWHLVKIGLHKDIIEALNSPYSYSTQDTIITIRHSKPISKFSHKGTFGHALIIAGSIGKIGAATLTVGACMRSGAGLTTAYIPKCGYTIMQISRPAAMALVDSQDEFISAIPELTPYSVIAIGPGVGTNTYTAKALSDLIEQTNVPLVIDADALNLLALYPALLAKLPPQSVLTPHPKEFERLAGNSLNHYERLQKAIAFAQNYQIILVLKGAHSAVIAPNGHVHFNSTGNPGMATGGSGDVLTGMITGYISQGYAPLQATILGVYMHGKAGDIVAQTRSYEGIIATDLIDVLGTY